MDHALSEGKRSVSGNLQHDSAPSHPFRLAYYPHWEKGNPYQTLFYDALAPCGVECIDDFEFNRRWLREQARQLDAVHIHWPEDLWRRYRPGWSSLRGYWRLHRVTQPLSSLQGLLALRRYLACAGRLGIKRLWTIHNLEHHEGASWIDRLGYRVLARFSDVLICTSGWAADEVARRYRSAGQVVVVPIGTYDGVYPPPRPRRVVLEELHLRDALPVVCCVGGLRDYKGLSLALKAVESLGGAVQLVVAGRPLSGYDPALLRSATARLPYVVLREEFVSDQAYSDIVAAADAVLLPYRKITGSAVLLAAWTLGRGVVASDLPYFCEMADGEPDSAHFFPPGDASALARAIVDYVNVPAERRQAATQRLAARYAWDRCVEPLADVIRAWRRLPE